MRIVLYLTNRIKYKWPKEYVDELIGKLNSRGHNTSVISDDTDGDVAKDVIEKCDVFVGVKSPFDGIAFSGKRVFIRAASEEGEGPLSSTQCAGCEEKIKDSLDCFFEDELCMREVTPNDVLGYL